MATLPTPCGETDSGVFTQDYATTALDAPKCSCSSIGSLTSDGRARAAVRAIAYEFTEDDRVLRYLVEEITTASEEKRTGANCAAALGPGGRWPGSTERVRLAAPRPSQTYDST